MNVTNLTMDVTKYATYNTGCLAEMEKCVQRCSEFQVQVSQAYTGRFATGFIILAILVIIRLYIASDRHEIFKNEKFIHYVTDKLTLTILLLIICLIYILYFI